MSVHRRRFNPEKDDPSNRTQEKIRQTYEQLADADVDGTALAKLRSDRYGDSKKWTFAQQLAAEHLTPPTLTQRVGAELEDSEMLSEAEREDVEHLMARAETMQAIDSDYADELREDALDLARYGSPESHVDALTETRVDRARGLLARSRVLNGPDAEYAATLREQAVDVIAESLTDQEAVDGDDRAIERDAKATLDAIKEGAVPEDTGDNGEGSSESETSDSSNSDSGGLTENTRRALRGQLGDD